MLGRSPAAPRRNRPRNPERGGVTYRGSYRLAADALPRLSAGDAEDAGAAGNGADG